MQLFNNNIEKSKTRQACLWRQMFEQSFSSISEQFTTLRFFPVKIRNQMKTKLFDFLCLLINHNAIKLLFSPSFPQPFWEIGEFSVKKYFTDHWQANTFQLFIAIKVDFSSPFFFCTRRSKGEFSRDYLINVGTYLFAYH